MTDREFFVYTVTDETPRFERVLKAIPTEHADYKPDPKSKTAMQSAAMMVGEAGEVMKTILSTGQIDFSQVSWPQFATPTEAAAAIVNMLGEVKALAESASEDTWNSTAQAVSNGTVEWETTRGKMAWAMLFDLIHHRGQVSTYLRAMGGAVPSIYGPSADSGE